MPRRLRVGIGGLSHETNTYSAEPTLLEAFTVWRGDQIRETFQGTDTYLGGMIAAAAEHRVDVVPLVHSEAEPGGLISRTAYDALRQELLTQIRQADRLDALVLSLHGAGAAKGVDDLEADVCGAIRGGILGARILGAALDLHGNISLDLVDVLDVVVGVKEYPHIDEVACGYRAMEMVLTAARDGAKPSLALRRVPLLISPALTSQGEPAGRIKDLCRQIEEQPAVLDCTFFHGFPHADTGVVGASVVASAQTPVEAEHAASRIARAVWDERASFMPQTLTAEDALQQAANVEGRPVVINEASDNPGGGAPGDGTHLLRAMLDARLSSACFGVVYDPAVAELAHQAGPGATIDIAVGGHCDALHGTPIEAHARVEAVSDGRITYKVIQRGFRDDLGPMARVAINGVQVVVGSVRRQVYDEGVFEMHGIDVRQCNVVGVKSTHHFRAAFEPLAAAIVTADTPGLTSRALESFPRTRTPRPIWPLDRDLAYAEPGL